MLVGVMALLLLTASILSGLRYIGPKVQLRDQQVAPRVQKEIIQKALYEFVARSYRLPCPADGSAPFGGTGTLGTTHTADGVENCTLRGSDLNSGVVPWKTLGLQYSDVIDGYNSRIGYAVSTALTSSSTTPYLKSVPVTGLTTGDSINVTVCAAVGNCAAATAYAYVLISFGNDRAGARMQSGAQIPAPPLTASSEYANAQAAAFTSGGTGFFVYPRCGSPVCTTSQNTKRLFDDVLAYETSSQVCNDINGAESGTNSAPYCTTSAGKSINTPPPCPSGGCTPLAMSANSGFGSMSATSTTTGANAGHGTSTTQATIATPPNSPGSPPVLYMGTENASGSGATLQNNSQSCVWFNVPLPWTTQTLRAYFEFSTSYSGQNGDGFTFSLLPAATSLTNVVPCGDTAGNNLIEGSYLGFVGIADGVQATATATIATCTKCVTALTLTSGGSGYSSAPRISFSGGGGSGASAGATIAGSVATISVANSGRGYSPSSVPAVTISGGNCAANCVAATATAKLGVFSNNNCAAGSPGPGQGCVLSITVTNGGSGYSVAPSVQVAAPTGCNNRFNRHSFCTTATASATISGSVVGVAITSPGSNYATTPSVVFSGGGGNGAAATATVTTNTGVTGIAIGNSGNGYLWAPPVSVAPPSSGTAATATVSSMAVSNVTVTNVGQYGYQAPSVTINDATGSGAGIAATVDYTQENGAVTGLTIATGGSGYTAPTLTIDAPISCAIGADCTSVTATATATVTNGVITGVQLTGGGSGYGSPPSLAISTPDNNGGTQAVGSVTSMSVTGITQTAAGAGYVPPPAVSLSGGGGSGATASATVTGTAVSAVTVSAGGSGYTSAPSVTFTGGGLADGTATISSGKVTSIAVADAGLGYASNPTVSISGGGGSGATATATINSGGMITGFKVTGGGSGYSSAPTVTVTDSSHGFATATATVSGGTVTGVTVASGGKGYVAAPTVTVTPVSGGCAGSCAAATVTATVGSSGAVTALNINYVGANYILPPTVAIAAPPTNSCAVSCSMASAVVSTMAVSGVTVTTAGSGYAWPPAVTINGPASCTANCDTATATAAAGMSILALSFTSGSGYSSSGAPAVTIPPPVVLPKMAVEFRTYGHEDDPYYDNYGYIDGQSPPPSASTAPQSFTAIRHDPNPFQEFMGMFVVDTLYHDDTYHYSTSTANGAMDNTGFTVSPSCDQSQSPPLGLHDNGYPPGGQAIGGNAGGCSYNPATPTANVITGNGPITATQNSTAVYYHPVRIEAQRLCDSACQTCGNTTIPTDVYVKIEAYLDCSSSALGGNSCSDLTQNLLLGTTISPPSTATIVNFCALDPGSTAPMQTSSPATAALTRSTAFDDLLIGFTAGSGAANGGEMIRNLYVGTY